MEEEVCLYRKWWFDQGQFILVIWESWAHEMDALATSRVRVAGPQRGRKGVVRTEEGEKSIAVSYIRRTLSLASIRAQSHSLLGRLEGLGRGVTAAMGRRREALELERVWLRERKAMALSLRNGFNILRRGFAKLD